MLTIEGLTIRTNVKTIVEQLELAVRPGNGVLLPAKVVAAKA